MIEESPTLLRLCLTLLLVSVVSTLNIHIIPHTHDVRFFFFYLVNSEFRIPLFILICLISVRMWDG